MVLTFTMFSSLITIGTEAAIAVSILYWAIGTIAATHTLNGIIALVDIGITGVPVRILHFVYPVISYSVFINYGAGGTNVFNQVLDYEYLLQVS